MHYPFLIPAQLVPYKHSLADIDDDTDNFW